MKRISLILALIFVLMLPVTVSAEIVTLPFSSFGGGAVVINFDYNTGNGNVLHFNCINNSDYAAWFGVYACDYETGGTTCSLLGERYCLAHETLEQSVPGLAIAWDLVDGGLKMCDDKKEICYQLRAGWPANLP